jgi:Fe-S-cluster containining protein
MRGSAGRHGLGALVGALDEETVDVTVAWDAGGEKLRREMAVPAGPTTPRRMLPVLREIAEASIQRGVARAEARGQRVSCKAGCGACCRQIVPISVTETFLLRELVDEMPRARREVILGRFEAGRRRLAEAGLLARLTDVSWITEEAIEPLGLEYFRLGIPCPFLEEESCSIHPDRPIVCREYLVTSPAEHCAHPTAETIAMVPVTPEISAELPKIETPDEPRAVPWVPLLLALDYADNHAEEEPKRTGTELLAALFERGKDKGAGQGSRAEKKGKGKRKGPR